MSRFTSLFAQPDGKPLRAALRCR